MRKKSIQVMTIGLAALAACMFVPLSGEATNSTLLEEKPLAGITLSLDHYCETVIQLAQEEETEAQKEEEAQAEEAEEKEAASKEQKEKEKKIKLNLKYDKLGIADVDTYLNVRKTASESGKIIGKMTKNTGCNVISVKKGWAKIESGSVRGYVKAEYLITGEAAEKKALKVATLKAVVKTETLNVRFLPTTDSRIYDQLSEDEDYTVEKENLTKDYIKTYISKYCSKKDVSEVDLSEMYDDLDNWVMLSIDNEKMFVSKDFVSLKYKLNRAVTIKQEKKKSSGTSSDSSSTASSIVDYAMQFLGNRYVWGGTSLTNGTDCSGFTMSIYSHFGYSLPRTSSAQAAATKTVSSSDVQVGDLFFYGSGSVSHVALYIGNGQIIHASNARDGIKISNAYYRKPIKIGRVM
ncbi:MAG: NlpC/P60 family protein [Clostridiaceae bacterium]|nr:NlpC/P60 family protein [Clostridiaceae bacterium]